MRYKPREPKPGVETGTIYWRLRVRSSFLVLDGVHAMTQQTVRIVLDDGSEFVLSVHNIAYVHFVPAGVGAKAKADVFFVGSERPLGMGEAAAIQLREALAGLGK
jgi:hypothetical protein